MTNHAIYQGWLEGLHGRTRYWRSAPSQGAPVLLIHGYGAMIEHWRAVMRPIAGRNTMLALDLHCFGQSSIPQAPPSRRLWADQAAELLAALAGGPAVVVGHSMGGMVAAQLAHDYPQLVRGLVLVDSTGLNAAQGQPSPLDSLIFDAIRAPGLGELMAGLVGNTWGARQGLLAAYYHKERVTPQLIEQFSAPLRRPGGAAAYLSVSRAFPQLFLEFGKGAIAAPTLLIWGQEDRSVPPSLAERFKAELIPQAEIAIIPASGHCPFDETPAAFCEILLPWIDRLA
jgi:pimeloyl-ACP methyl ester carboxylesterase